MKTISKIIFVVFCMLLAGGNICQGQVKIKERVEIEQKKNQLFKTSNIFTDSHFLKAIVEWDTTGGTFHYLRARLKIVNDCTNETIISEYAYHGYAEVIMNAETAGNYGIAALTESNYYPIDNSWFAFSFSHSLKVYADDQLIYAGSYNTSVDPWYGKLKLTVSGDDLVCSDDKISFNIGDENCSTITGLKNNDDVTLSILEGAGYSSFYDETCGVNLGQSVTTPLSNANNISLMLDSLYLGDSDTNIVISIVSEWLNELDTISVISVKDISELKIYTDSYEGPPTDTGKTEYIDVYAEKGGHCDIPYEELPEETKYNVKITKGSELGVIGYQPDGWEITQRGTELYNLDHNYGWLYLIFLSNVSTPTHRDTVIINVSTTDPALEPVDVMFFIQPDPLFAYADPNPVIAGDTARIILKHFTDNGVFEDFPNDTAFDIDIYEGYDYGTIFSSTVSDTSDYFYDTQGDFSFVAADSIDADSVSVIVWVGTRIESDDSGAISGNIKSTGKELSIPVYNESTDKTTNKKEIIRTTKEQESIRRGRKNQLTNSRKEKIKNHAKEKASGLSNIMSDYIYAETEFEILVIKDIQTDSVNYFEINIIPDTLSVADTLAYREGATIFIEAVDSLMNTVSFDDDEILKLKITNNAEYLRFVDEIGDTLNAQTKEIEKPYSVFNDRKIKVVAIDNNPNNNVSSLLRVISVGDTLIYGEKEAVILRKGLKIDITGEREVQPIITSERNDETVRTYLQNITNANKKEFSVSFMRGDKKLGGHRFKLTSDYIDGSGGHDHITPRRPRLDDDPNITERLRRQNYGSFYSYKSGATFTVDSIHSIVNGITIQDSVSRFDYVASIWGDSVKIKLASLDNSLYMDSIIIIERIPDLTLLPDGINYRKIGGTCDHHGPRDDNQNPICQTPDNNHYVSEGVLQHITEIASTWHSRFPDEEIMMINDLSLPFGGKFDINGQWTGAHATHREGRDMDIRTELYYINTNGLIVHRQGIPIRSPRLEPFNSSDGNSEIILHREFERICEANNGIAHIHGGNSTSEHYHVDFD